MHVGGVTDVINCAKFLEISSGVPELEDPEKWHFPLKAFIALTTVLRYRADCDDDDEPAYLRKNKKNIGIYCLKTGFRVITHFGSNFLKISQTGSRDKNDKIT